MKSYEVIYETYETTINSLIFISISHIETLQSLQFTSSNCCFNHASLWANQLLPTAPTASMARPSLHTVASALARRIAAVVLRGADPVPQAPVAWAKWCRLENGGVAWDLRKSYEKMGNSWKFILLTVVFSNFFVVKFCRTCCPNISKIMKSISGKLRNLRWAIRTASILLPLLEETIAAPRSLARSGKLAAWARSKALWFWKFPQDGAWGSTSYVHQETSPLSMLLQVIDIKK